MKPNRRTILQSLAAAPMAAAMVWTDAEAQQAHHQAQAAADGGEAGGAVQAEVLHAPTSMRPSGCSSISSSRRTSAPGSATDAGVPQFMDFMMVDQPARQTAMRGGLAWLDRECVTRFEKDFLTCTPRSGRRCSTRSLAAEGRPGARARRRVLQQLPRPHRERVLHQQDGDRGPAVHGATATCRSGLAAPEVMKKLGVSFDSR